MSEDDISKNKITGESGDGKKIEKEGSNSTCSRIPKAQLSVYQPQNENITIGVDDEFSYQITDDDDVICKEYDSENGDIIRTGLNFNSNVNTFN